MVSDRLRVKKLLENTGVAHCIKTNNLDEHSNVAEKRTRPTYRLLSSPTLSFFFLLEITDISAYDVRCSARACTAPNIQAQRELGQVMKGRWCVGPANA